MKLDWDIFHRFSSHVLQNGYKTRTALYGDIISSSIKYNISILDYFYFRFYRNVTTERDAYAGTGFMYEYQLKMNPNSSRTVLKNKVEFLEEFAQYVRRDHATLDDLVNDPVVAEKLLSNKSGKIVLKSSDGQCGTGVEVLDSLDTSPVALIERLRGTGNNLAEEYVVQHPELMRLSPSGLNTVRIITQLDKDNHVVILGSRLRISVNSIVDNMAAGNMAAPIDIETGSLTGPAVYSDIAKPEESAHPVTGTKIEGFQIPYWEESLRLAKSAALVNSANRSIGWDVAITPDGPELIEGNHNWCKLLWQLPVKKGLKSELLQYL